MHACAPNSVTTIFDMKLPDTITYGERSSHFISLFHLIPFLNNNKLMYSTPPIVDLIKGECDILQTTSENTRWSNRFNNELIL